MPRAVQSKESAIIAFFRTVPIEIAQLVYRLAGDEVKARVQRSTEAKQRAKQVTPPAARPAAAPAPAPKKKAKKKAKKRPVPVVTEPVYSEDDLNQ